MKQLFWFVFTLCLFSCSLVQADELCSQSLKEKQYSEAFPACLQAATQGDASAQSNLAYLYQFGKGTAKNLINAAEWHTKAAQQGIAYSQYHLGMMYKNGFGAPKNSAQAQHWLEKSAAQNYRRAIDALAELSKGAWDAPTAEPQPFSSPNARSQQVFSSETVREQSQTKTTSTNGIPKNESNCQRLIDSEQFSEAIPACEHEAQAGYPSSQFYLAELYRRNKPGVSANYTKALKWYEQAAKQNLTEAQYQLGTMHYEGIGTPKDFKVAAQWLQVASNAGHPQAQNQLFLVNKSIADQQTSTTDPISTPSPLPAQGPVDDRAETLYQLAINTMANDSSSQGQKEAFTILKQAAGYDYPPAQYKLGTFYLDGIGTSRDLKLGLQWIEHAANNKMAEAQNFLGERYLKGLGVTRDYRTAVQWLQKAVRQNLPQAQFNVASMYHKGVAFKQDSQKAFSWYAKAAAQDHAQAQYALANMYETGLGTTKNIELAKQWYARSAEAYPPSQAKLANINMMHTPSTTTSSQQSTKTTTTTKTQESANDPDTQIFFGQHWQYGWKGQNDLQQALGWYKKAAAQNSAEGLYRVGTFYEKGWAVSKAPQQAANFYYKAAKLGSTKAMHRLAMLYLNRGKTEDAMKWFSYISRRLDQPKCSTAPVTGEISADSCKVEKR